VIICYNAVERSEMTQSVDDMIAKAHRQIASIKLEHEMRRAEHELRNIECERAKASYSRTLALAQALTGLSEIEILERANKE